jgi:hypothetical protein
MISVRGTDVPAWTQPVAIFVGEIIPVNQLNPFDVCCELYDAAFRPFGGSKRQTSQNETWHKQHCSNQRLSDIARRWQLKPPHLPLQ